ncbi:MAG: DUF835 domain-containing protein [Methanobacteriota archaeon]
MGAASALFLSALVIGSIARQKTHRAFQKRVLLFGTILLVCAVFVNIVATIYAIQPVADLASVERGIILAKQIQATFDYLYAIAIGAFVVVATTPAIASRQDFLRHMTREFPNSYVFYVFIMIVAVVSIIAAPATVVSISPLVLQFDGVLLFTNGLAVATIVLFTWYRIVAYLRKRKVSAEVRRGSLFIVLGVTGIAVGELVFEVVLPYFFIDVRSAGFIVVLAFMGLIAFSVRERSFLQELVLPATEAHLLTKPRYELERGYTYAILEQDGKEAFEIFKDFVTHGAQGLCVTRRAPKSVVSEYGLERTPILWLSRVASEKNSVRPSPPENIAVAIEHFVDIGQRGVVLLDGFEYLVSHNDFNSVLALVHDLNEKISLQDAILLLPIDPAVLNEKEIALVRREVRILGPLAKGFEAGEKAVVR